MTYKATQITVVDLETMEAVVLPSRSAAAKKMGFSRSRTDTMLDDGKPREHWFATFTADFDKIDLEAKCIYYRQHIKKFKATAPRQEKKPLVALRIDRHTVIYVTPDKANQAYAEQWREKYLSQGRRGASTLKNAFV